MDHGVIGMPFDLAMSSELSRRQFYGRAQAVLAERDQLRAEVEALRKDAERYRWLRRQPNDCSAPRIDICHWQRNGDDSVNEGEGLRLEAADEAIDAAMAAKEGEHCAHANSMTQYTGDGTPVDYCPDCGRNKVDGATPEPEHICQGCGAKGWTANCDQCIPY